MFTFGVQQPKCRLSSGGRDATGGGRDATGGRRAPKSGGSATTEVPSTEKSNAKKNNMSDALADDMSVDQQ